MCSESLSVRAMGQLGKGNGHGQMERVLRCQARLLSETFFSFGLFITPYLVVAKTWPCPFIRIGKRDCV